MSLPVAITRLETATVVTRLLQGRIARSAAGTLGLRVFHSGLRLVISLALARILGAAGYGAYSFALTCVGVLSVPALLGFDSLLVREVASYRARAQWGLLRGLLRRANQLALAASIALALAGAGAAWVLATHFEPQMVMTFSVGLLALPFLTLMRTKQATLVGLQNVVAGQVPETLVQPVLFAILLGIVAILPVEPANAPTVVGLYGASAVVALLTAVAILREAQPGEISQAHPEYSLRAWMRSARAFIMVSSLNVLGTSLGIIMLGLMKGAEATGVFGIANAAAALIALPLVAINAPLAPAVSAVFSEGNKVELQRLATKAARGAFLLCLPLALVYILFGKWVLWLFGEEFTAGYMALMILSIGQVINAGMGSVGLLLNMTGHERDVALGLAIAVAFNVIVNLALIPDWGVTGAAVGAAANVVLWNVILAIWVHRRLGIRPTAVG